MLGGPNAGAFKPIAQHAESFPQRVALGARAQRKHSHQRENDCHYDRKHERQAFPIWRQPQQSDQIALAFLRIRQYPLVPRVLHRFPVEPYRAQPGGTARAG